MSATLGPVLLIGGITVFNESILNDKNFTAKVPIATGIAALMFSGLEKIWPKGAVALAYMSLAAICLTRINPSVPSPVESLAKTWKTF